MPSRPRCRLAGLPALLFVCVMALSACDSAEERVAEHYENGLELLEQGQPEKAVLEFRNALQIDEGFIPARMEFARVLLEQGDARGAFGNFQRVVELDPANAEAQLELARLLLGAGQFDKALTHADAAHKAAPNDPDALVARAVAHYRLDHTDQAIADAKQVLVLRPGDPQAELLLVNEQMAAGDIDAASALVDKALADNAADLPLNLMKLRILSAQGDNAAVGAHLEGLVELHPDNVSLHQLLARWYASENRPDDVEHELRNILELGPDDMAAAQNLVRFLLQTRGKEAARDEILAEIDAAKQRSADVFPFQAMLADFDTQLGQKDDARALLEGVIADTTDTETANKARLKLARLALSENDTDRAGELVGKVLADDAKNAEALAMRAAIRAEKGELDKAVIDLRAALNENPENVGLLRLAARVYELSGSPELAGSSLASAVRLSNADPDIVFAYLAFLQKTGQGSTMEAVLRDAVDRRPDSPQLLSALGSVYVEKQDWGAAGRIAEQLRPLDADAADRLTAAVLIGRGRTEEAVALLDRIGQTADTGSMASTIVQVYVRSGQRTAARDFVDGLLAENPQNAEALRLDGALLQLDGKIDAARDAFGKAIAADPENATGYLALAGLQRGAGDPQAAAATIAEGLAALPDNSLLLLDQADRMNRTGDYEGALAAFEKLFEMRPESVIAANNLASVLSEHFADDPAKVARAAEVARRLAGVQSPQIQDTYGWIKYLEGKPDEALRSLIPAAEGLPKNPWVRYHAGMAYAALDQKEEARGHLEAALELSKSGEFSGAFPPAAEIRSTLDALAQQN